MDLGAKIAEMSNAPRASFACVELSDKLRKEANCIKRYEGDVLGPRLSFVFTLNGLQHT